jgi:hypothetical protein
MTPLNKANTLRQEPTSLALAAGETPRKKLINPNSRAIGPSIGAYYSPVNGYEVNIDFGIRFISD